MGMHVTVKQKILLHLMRFNVTPETGFTVAYDITQDGIASVIGVTRAHVSVELKRMTEDGRLICWKAHLAGSSIKRLAYAVTPRGLSEAETIQKTLLENGIIPEMLLDMNGCSPGDLWNTLDEADRDVLGMVCVLRRRIPRNDLPKMSNATLPVDMEGLVSIPKAAARNYLTYASAARTRAWNSWAAEYWLSHNDYVERLYHLTMAGRMREASKNHGPTVSPISPAAKRNVTISAAISSTLLRKRWGRSREHRIVRPQMMRNTGPNVCKKPRISSIRRSLRAGMARRSGQKDGKTSENCRCSRYFMLAIQYLKSDLNFARVVSRTTSWR